MKFKSKILFGIFIILASLFVFEGCVEKRKSEEGLTAAADVRQNDFFKGEYIPDIEVFMQIGYITNAAISDDGRRIFYCPSYTNARQLFRVTDGGWPYQLTSFEDGINWYSLSHDSYYAIVGAARGGDENTQLYLLDTETGRMKKLTHRPEVRYGSVVWTYDDKIIYFSSNAANLRDFMIYKMDLPEGEIEVVQEKEGMNGPVEISKDGKYLTTYHAVTSRDNNFYLLNLETGEEELLTPHEGEYLYGSISMMPDFKTAYITTNNTPDGITRLARLDVAAKEITFLEPDQKWEVTGAFVDETGRYLGWMLNEEGYSKPFVKNLETGKMMPLPEMEGMYGFSGMTDDGKILFSFNNANHPPDIWIWDLATQKLRQVTNVSTMGIDVSKFVEPKLIKYKSFDGLEIPAFLYLPAGYTEEPIPFIMDVHGGPEGQARPNFNCHYNYLMAHGFGLFAPNVRGSEGYGKEYLDMDNYKNRMKSVADAAEGVRWLIENGYTAADMMGVKGVSYGGYMVMALITEYPDLFAAAWDQVGIVNFVTFLKNTSSYRQAFRESEYGPLTDREFLASISPIHKVGRIKCPLMVVHGENDPRVPISEARQIISELKGRGGVVDSLIFANEGHGITKLENRLISYRRMVDFFKEHLMK